jgi:hypothetical protein
MRFSSPTPHAQCDDAPCSMLHAQYPLPPGDCDRLVRFCDCHTGKNAGTLVGKGYKSCLPQRNNIIFTFTVDAKAVLLQIPICPQGGVLLCISGSYRPSVRF